MKEDLALKGLLAVVCDDDAGRKTLLAECDAVNHGEGVRPELLGLVAEAGRAQTKVELHGRVGHAGGLRGGLAQQFPFRGPGEAVLG